MPVAALLNRVRVTVLIALWLGFGGALGSKAQPPSLPDCADRPTALHDELYVDNIRWCVEHVVHAMELEPLSFTALAVAPDGRLFAARPLAGQVMVIHDSNGDTLPDTMDTYADGLSLPNGLEFHDGYLYVAGGPHIYRIASSDDVEILVDDLPSGTGFATGGIAIGAGDRLYVAMGAPCSLCEFDEPERGAILTYEPRWR